MEVPRWGLVSRDGISLAYPVMRHMLNLDPVLPYQGTEGVDPPVLGEAITGRAAYRGGRDD